MNNTVYDRTLYSSTIDTPIGRMVTLADETSIYLLKFLDNDLDIEIKKFKEYQKFQLTKKSNKTIELLNRELESYFNGSLQSFTTEVSLFGTDFQKLVWSNLISIPYGRTRSYKEHAKHINKEKAYRAVGGANCANNILILVPCHRIIQQDNKLGGYNSGTHRKEFLINHEKSVLKASK